MISIIIKDKEHEPPSILEHSSHGTMRGNDNDQVSQSQYGYDHIQNQYRPQQSQSINMNEDRLSTVAPRRHQFGIPERPQNLKQFPPSHAKTINLTMNAIPAQVQIHGILPQSMVRFHATSNDPNDADIPEHNRERRREIIEREFSFYA